MRFCCTNSGDGSKVHLRLLGCSAFVATWLFLSFTWLRQFCLGGSHQFQVQALQPCSGQSNRTSFIDSSMMGYQCYGPSGRDAFFIVCYLQAPRGFCDLAHLKTFKLPVCCILALLVCRANRSRNLKYIRRSAASTSWCYSKQQGSLC